MIKSGVGDKLGHLERALELNPYFVPAWKASIEHKIKQRQFDEARQLLRRAREVLTAEKLAELEEAVRPGIPKTG